jgi:2-polyprenyl-6-hydroxyphenyl methylase/3-demethylubiquinone-9 3-methyltransferase
MKQFDFGKNWQDFSHKALDYKKIQKAREDFSYLTQDIDLQGKSFLDIGFGQGLSLLIATEKGGKTFGCDINPKCQTVLEQNKKYFDKLPNENIPVVVGSIIDKSAIQEIKDKKQSFDIVHSWGVLHHTGNMYKALQTAANLTANNGFLIIAIYNKHWTSPLWHFIKKLYNQVPGFLKKIMLYLYIPLLYLRSLFGGLKNFKPKRGMSFYYDAKDWLGGYPYEYASPEEIINFLQVDFNLVRFIPTNGFTGCNQFVFKKNNNSGAKN